MLKGRKGKQAVGKHWLDLNTYLAIEHRRLAFIYTSHPVPPSSLRLNNPETSSTLLCVAHPTHCPQPASKKVPRMLKRYLYPNPPPRPAQRRLVPQSTSIDYDAHAYFNMTFKARSVDGGWEITRSTRQFAFLCINSTQFSGVAIEGLPAGMPDSWATQKQDTVNRYAFEGCYTLLVDWHMRIRYTTYQNTARSRFQFLSSASHNPTSITKYSFDEY